MTAEPPARELEFRTSWISLLVIVAFELACLGPLWVLLGHPDLFTFDYLVGLAVMVVGGVYVGWLGGTTWETSWHLRLTATHLIADHTYRRQRLEVPWTSIRGITRPPQPWWNRGGRRCTRVELADGGHILVGPQLDRYGEFVKEMRARTEPPW
jgi:hypothetical protein